MSNLNQQETTTKRLRSVQEIIDHEFMTIGDHFGKVWTKEELEESRLLANKFDIELASGRSVDEINAEWENKTPQEILAMPNVNAHSPQ